MFDDRYRLVIVHAFVHLVGKCDLHLPGHSIIYMVSASGRHVMEMAVLDRRDLHLWERDTSSLE